MNAEEDNCPTYPPRISARLRLGGALGFNTAVTPESDRIPASAPVAPGRRARKVPPGWPGESDGGPGWQAHDPAPSPAPLAVAKAPCQCESEESSRAAHTRSELEALKLRHHTTLSWVQGDLTGLVLCARLCAAGAPGRPNQSPGPSGVTASQVTVAGAGPRKPPLRSGL